MELEDRGDEVMEENLNGQLAEECEYENLPEEWIYSFLDGKSKESSYDIGPGNEDDSQTTGNEKLMLDKLEGRKEEVKETKLKQGNKKWGPIQAEKKSSRVVDDGRTAMEKAQNLKRKVNLEDNPGMKSYVSAVLTKNDILM